MARQFKSLEFARILFLAMALLLCFLVWTTDSQRLGAQETGLSRKHPESWCIAKPSASDAALQDDIQYVCSQMGIDCSIIQPNGACYEPNNLVSHASVVMNLFYKLNDMKQWTCVFSYTSLIVWDDPSVGPCVYQ